MDVDDEAESPAEAAAVLVEIRGNQEDCVKPSSENRLDDDALPTKETLCRDFADVNSAVIMESVDGDANADDSETICSADRDSNAG